MKIENIIFQEHATMWVLTFFFDNCSQYHLIIEKEASLFSLIKDMSSVIQTFATLGEKNA
jgi:hypothetical protein